MPYKLDDFPITVDKPYVEVTLPEGKHVFELVVIDSAGLKSLPDRVEITVAYQKPALPTVTSLAPRFGLQGEKLQVTLTGTALRYTKDFALLRGKVPDDDFVITLPSGHTNDTSITIGVAIAGNADIGSRPFRLTTLGGETSSGPDLKLRFRVVGTPAISGVKTAGPNPGETDLFEVLGSNLFLEGEPASEHRVEFVLDGKVATTIKAEVQEKSKPETLKVMATVGADAKKGKYAVRVTTPAGHSAVSTPTYEVK